MALAPAAPATLQDILNLQQTLQTFVTIQLTNQQQNLQNFVTNQLINQTLLIGNAMGQMATTIADEIVLNG
jgi:hypothetical protein